MLVQPWPQRVGVHPVDARGTGVSLDPSQRPGEVLAGEKVLPEARLGGVRHGLVRRREAAPLSARVFGLHPPTFPPRPRAGLAALIATPASAGVLLPRLRVRPFPAHVPIPAGTTASADFSAARACLPAAPSLATRRSRWPGIPGHPRRPPRIRAAPFPAHPPRLRCGPLMTAGFAARCRLARAAPPPTRFVSLGSRVRLRLPSHPTSR